MATYNVAGYNTRWFYHTKYYHFNHRTLRIFYFYVFIIRETIKYEPFKQATSMIVVLSRVVKITIVLILIDTY